MLETNSSLLRSWLLPLLFVTGFLLASCSAGSGDHGANGATGASFKTETLMPATAALTSPAQEVGGNRETTTSSVSSVGHGSPEYGIGPGDVLQISVFNVPNLSANAQVAVDGTILLPLIGTVRVAGESTSEASRQIAAKLGDKYLRSPQVSVFVSHSAQRISVNGAVEHPGVITLDGTLTLTQAVAQAGGANDVADENRVHIARLMGNQTVQDTIFDLEAIKGGATQDPTLHSGDIVVVEESGKRMAFKTLLQLIPAVSSIATIGLMGMGL